MSSEVEISSTKGPRVSLDARSTRPTLRYHYGVRRLTRELCIRSSSSWNRLDCVGLFVPGLGTVGWVGFCKRASPAKEPTIAPATTIAITSIALLFIHDAVVGKLGTARAILLTAEYLRDCKGIPLP